jgi:hypothetical protein
MYSRLSAQYAKYDYQENMLDKCHYINNDQCGNYCLMRKGIVWHRVTNGSLCNIPEASTDGRKTGNVVINSIFVTLSMLRRAMPICT